MESTRSEERFGVALRDVLLEREDYEAGVRAGARQVDWRRFAQDLPGVNYETLRKAVGGIREPSVAVMEHVAKFLKIDPSYFAEYRIAQAQRAVDPDQVGFEEALRQADELTR